MKRLFYILVGLLTFILGGYLAAVWLTRTNVRVIRHDSAGVPRNWKTVELSDFSFSLPPDMRDEEVKGIDSAVWQYRNDGMILTIDYGMYSNSLESYKSQPGHHEEWFLIGGKRAKICTFQLDESFMNTAEDRDFSFISAAYFPEVRESSVAKLSIWVNAKGTGEQEAAKKIFQSVEFK
jgi:hypothetical protein